MLGRHMRFCIVVLAIALLAASCKGEALDIRGDWSLKAYGPAAVPVEALPGVETTVQFGRDGSVAGNLGCNSFGGEYTVENSTLTFASLVATEMYCEQTSEQESAVFAILSGGPLVVDVADGLMTLKSADESTVVLLQRK